MLTVREVANATFGNDLSSGFIGIYGEDEYGNVMPIYPDFADEYVETHGNLSVKNYRYVKSQNTLVIEIDKE